MICLNILSCVTSASSTCGLSSNRDSECVGLALEPWWGWLGADHLPPAASKPLDLHSPHQIAANSRELHLFCCDLSKSILIGNTNGMVCLPQPQSA